MGIPSTRLLLVEELVGGSPEETQSWLVFRGGGTAEQGQLHKPPQHGAWPHAHPPLAVVQDSISLPELPAQAKPQCRGVITGSHRIYWVSTKLGCSAPWPWV